MLFLNNIVSGYGKIPVVRDITLKIQNGEFIALAGANNAGKSTLLKTIAGVLKPSSGEIQYEGRNIHTKETHEIVNIGISFISEGRPIFHEMSVMDNLLIGSYLPRTRKARQDSLERVFQIFPILKERQKQVSGSLSGGEQQMLVLGRALMSNPRFLLVDEPSLGLSPLMTERIYRVLRDLNSQGVGLLVADQNFMTLTTVSSCVHVLANGTIFASGNGTDLLKNEAVCKACMGLVEARKVK
ncbi:MAG: ABC transporter ATP-binding protein [Dehalococcoidales bacterium]|nr:ABC transporter ATP-binding protein [Dehalococcoidales bacterium]